MSREDEAAAVRAHLTDPLGHHAEDWRMFTELDNPFITHEALHGGSWATSDVPRHPEVAS